MLQEMDPAYLVLEDGSVFAGRAVGAPGVSAGEACFTTAMAGYEEAVTDPSYAAQVLAFSYPSRRMPRRTRRQPGAWLAAGLQRDGDAAVTRRQASRSGNPAPAPCRAHRFLTSRGRPE